MKRFKEAIASDDSYSAVGFSYDQYYPTYNYGSAQDISMSAALCQPYIQQESGK